VARRTNPPPGAAAKCLKVLDFAVLARLLLKSLHHPFGFQGTATMQDTAAADTAAETRTNVLLRNDTFLGVCEAIGEDFGFHANWLRILFAASLYWFPAQAVGVYLGLGLIVLLSRLVAPDRVLHAATTSDVDAPAEPAAEELPLAA
jgi:phage shock protein PspC (stress-responsive transcriptional regulator)